MKPTIKVSIAGYAFVLEEDAYKEVDNYLVLLKSHFEYKEDGKEIILDVETRISELLRLKADKKNDQVVSVDDVREIVKMIGAPKDMDDSASEAPKEEKKQAFNFEKKRIFRDTEHSILGGVCSGIAQYFKTDPVFIRIAYVLLFILSGFIAGKIRLFLVLLYLVAWVIMPKAKTMFQKMQMIGNNPSIDNIESREGVSFNRERDARVVKAIKVIVGIFLGLISFSLLMSLIAIVGVFFGVLALKGMPSFDEVLSIFSIDSWGIKISLILAAILPLIGLIYTTIKLLFQSRFTKRYFIVSGFAFFTWIGILCYIGGYAGVYAQQFESNYTAVDTVNIETQSDKFYVRLGDGYNGVKPLYLITHNNDKPIGAIAYYTKDSGRYSLVIMPNFVVKQDASLQDIKVEIEKKAFDTDYESATLKAEHTAFDYVLQDSLLIINPTKYTSENNWDRMLYKVIVSVPANKEVVYDNSLLYDKKQIFKTNKSKKKKKIKWDDIDL